MNFDVLPLKRFMKRYMQIKIESAILRLLRKEISFSKCSSNIAFLFN